MDIAALITWIVTALGGFAMLGIWISRGGLRRDEGAPTRLPSPVVFGHLLLAAAGLVAWILYLATGSAALGWTALVLLVPVALLGFVMLARWIPVHRAAAPGTAAPETSAPATDAFQTTAPGTAPGAAAGAVAPAERHFPVAVVIGHGVLAVVTLVLVLLTVLG
ncbi:hypothetical protein B0I32_105150 [Nonomuraea fuscirosea]|uniref:Uncharacterized protein n=1 Tax=Nonomuraea fuscirosea TaxID=1291556 RepID=A0A2T0N3K6_9ACTN|nr:hypothetical protein [Nonomuraea fuscirosea]PRX66710.1 hypothetical protein B0I32_105150 [Nonomuraea fuscirosea]